jgi:hypothetical protein
METGRMNQEIHVDIAPDGSLRIEAHGFAGSSCRAATAPIERALGAVRARRAKAETRQARTTTRLRNGLGGA